ncbi:hypothetical protein C8R44DRAFT_893935 [Mycena epipterygia]|nr:hypothetical protein C8R44DRAFT_893935 [Mycena epipterygia]
MLGKLLTVGIADPGAPDDPKYRAGSLNEQFDRHLSQAENVTSLFIELDDQRMAQDSPAYVIPSLRKTLIWLLTELQCSIVALNRDRRVNTQRLIKPYAYLIFAVLLQKTKRAPPGEVPASMLTSLATLASVGGEDAPMQVLLDVVNFSDHASRIVQPLMHILECGVHELRMDTLCALIVQVGSDFVIFVPTISRCVSLAAITHVGYDRVVMTLLNGERLTLEPNMLLCAFIYFLRQRDADSNCRTNDPKLAEFALAEAGKLAVNQIHLKQAWDMAQINAWQDWIH